MRQTLRRNAPFWLSILAGIALWEIAGRLTSAAFMVPFSETLVRLWQLVTTGEFIAQFLDSAKLFLTGFVLALDRRHAASACCWRVRACCASASSPTS